MTNDDRSNDDRTGDGQAPTWGDPRQQPAADAPRYGERVDPAPGSTPQYGEQAPQYGQQPNQHGQQQYGQQDQYGQQQQNQYSQQPYGQQHGAAAPANAGGPAWQSYDEPKRKKKTVGVVAFIVGLLALIVAVIGGYLFGAAFGDSDAVRESLQNGGTATPSESDLMELTSSGGAVAGSLLFYLGTALGLWAIVQGIVAAVTKRGRAWGIFAIVLAVVAVIVFVVVIGISAAALAGV